MFATISARCTSATPITIELLPHAGSYRVSFSNSNVPAPDDVTKSKREVWKVVAPPQYPLPQLFEEGDELPLALTGSATGVQLVDYIHIGSIGKMPKRTEAARDSTRRIPNSPSRGRRCA